MIGLDGEASRNGLRREAEVGGQDARRGEGRVRGAGAGEAGEARLPRELIGEHGGGGDRDGAGLGVEGEGVDLVEGAAVFGEEGDGGAGGAERGVGGAEGAVVGGVGEASAGEVASGASGEASGGESSVAVSAGVSVDASASGPAPASRSASGAASDVDESFDGEASCIDPVSAPPSRLDASASGPASAGIALFGELEHAKQASAQEQERRVRRVADAIAMKVDSIRASVRRE